MSLVYSSKQEQVASLFTAYRNDIDIYTEDQDRDKLFYKKLFSRLLEGTGINVRDVYPLGSSSDVISACSADTDTTRKKIYIVDGDIYLMFNPKNIIPNLFVLDAYCIENYVIDEESVCNALCNLYAEKECDDIKKIFQFDALIKEHLSSLMDLFYYFALEKKYTNVFKLKSLGAFYTKDKLNIEAIEKEIKEIKERLLSANIKECDIDSDLAQLMIDFPKIPSVFLRIVSGKDYLIHMVSCHASNVLSIRTKYTKNAWKYNMVQYCDLSRLASLRTAIDAKCHASDEIS